MPCCIAALLAVIAPRVVLVLLFLFTNYLSRAYHGILIPLLGFLFLPFTTIVYAWIVNSGQTVHDLYLVVLIVAVVFDLGGIGGGHYSRHRQ